MQISKPTLVLKVDPEDPDEKTVLLAAKVLKKGGLVAFPTETVYGLGANLQDKRAIDRLYDVKRRPKDKPFTVHIADLRMMKRMGCSVTREARRLIAKFWPGPLTIILRSKENKRIGFRMPDNIVALELIEKAGVPVVAPSANISGKTPPRDSKEVLKCLGGKIEVLLDAGRTKIGVESTVIDLTVKPPRILREGAIKLRDLTWLK